MAMSESTGDVGKALLKASFWAFVINIILPAVRLHLLHVLGAIATPFPTDITRARASAPSPMVLTRFCRRTQHPALAKASVEIHAYCTFDAWDHTGDVRVARLSVGGMTAHAVTWNGVGRFHRLKEGRRQMVAAAWKKVVMTCRSGWSGGLLR
ncbi:hypothetical protein C0991_001192 [Blastosporella zonata]|nr:hypothetical protein C0991_001192 [Blastosporella zonata]